MSMMTRHTTDQERMLYVMDALEPDQREQLESHLLRCPDCHAAVLAEARVELNLRELCAQLPAETVEMTPAPQPMITAGHPAVRAPRRQPMHLALWAMSAAVLLIVLWRAEPQSTRQHRSSQTRQLFTDNPSLELTSRAPEDQASWPGSGSVAPTIRERSWPRRRRLCRPLSASPRGWPPPRRRACCLPLPETRSWLVPAVHNRPGRHYTCGP